MLQNKAEVHYKLNAFQNKAISKFDAEKIMRLAPIYKRLTAYIMFGLTFLYIEIIIMPRIVNDFSM